MSDTFFCGLPPPTQIYGNQDYHNELQHEGSHPKPIPLPGEWQISRTIVKTDYWDVRLYYWAWTMKYQTKFGSYHTRLGDRYDDNENCHVPWSGTFLKIINDNLDRLVWLRELRKMEHDRC